MKGQPYKNARGSGGPSRDESGGGPDPVNRPVAIIGVVPMKVSGLRHHEDFLQSHSARRTLTDS
jgi:hypothetical protein